MSSAGNPFIGALLYSPLLFHSFLLHGLVPYVSALVMQ